MKVQPKDIELGSVFKFGFSASLCIFLPFGLIMGLSSFFGGSAVFSNGHPVYGVRGLLTALVLSFLFPLLGAVVLFLGTIPLQLMGARAPQLRVRSPE